MKKGANILLSTMQLDIGGAETHIVELAKELGRRGYNVIVTSNGGAYVKELEEANIRHYIVPLQNKKPQNMIKAAKRLAGIIKKENIDIVHSHARIPSFILGKLHKRMHFPFVTTAHWVFTTKYGLKYITDWGDKCVAVSEDIKTYLMDNYGIPEGDIRVTINGIDTEKFSPDTDVSDIKAEFGIKDDDFVIVYVSRMDESRSLAAKQLIESVPEIDKKAKGLRVIIVGGGDDFNNVKAMAKNVNDKLGRECISLAGARTDINKFAAAGDLFVGVSRAALEAMAAARPVIIAGNEGYIGLFDESKLKVGIDTNFCCRGCEDSSSKLILADIEKFLALAPEEKKALGEYGRKLIIENYSVARMADDTLAVYDWELSKQKEILISGYYGFKNSGDDALLLAIINELKAHKESPNIVVLSANPKETRKTYRVKSINRINVFSVLRHMKRADMLISGGGTLIQDRTSTKSLLYYLAVIRAAIGSGVKVMLYSNGIGPLSRKKNIEITKKVLNKVDLITLRDENSLETLKKIGVTQPPVCVTADPALTLKIPDESRGKAILAEGGVPAGRKYLGVSVRKWNGIGEDFETMMARICDSVAQKYGLYPVFLPMQASKDLQISKNIAAKMKTKASVIENHQEVEDMLSAVGCMELCIGMRLHTLMYAAINRVPLVGLVYDPKIKGFMDNMHQTRYVEVEKMSEQSVMSLIDECMENYEEIKIQLEKSYETLKAKANKNGSYAIELYEKGSVEL